MEHEKPKQAKWRVHFKNGNCRDVCSRCVKQFRENGGYAKIVEQIEILKQ